MDLAIGWNYRPANAADEPKQPAHIDGSNDIVAPAIFNVVKTPREISEHNTGRSAGVFSHTAGEADFFDKDIMLRNRNYFSTQLDKNTDRTCKCGSNNGSNRSHSANRQGQQLDQLKNRCKSSPNLSIQVQPSESISPKESIIVCNYNKEHYHYRPHPSASAHRHSKPAVKKHNCCNVTVKQKQNSCERTRLCEQNVAKLNQCYKKQPDFKCAFKAGVPKSNLSGFCSSFENSSNGSSGTASEFTSKLIKIPKPRHPYAKKNYTIDTLVPPFSCWKGGAGQGGYPEHWRLQSIYQHAYKPPEQRKRPLLATVYQ